MPRAYYTLVTRPYPGGLWHPQFGAYDRAEVEAERHDYYGPSAGRKRTDTRILRHGPGRDGQETAIEALNAPVYAALRAQSTGNGAILCPSCATPLLAPHCEARYCPACAWCEDHGHDCPEVRVRLHRAAKPPKGSRMPEYIGNACHVTDDRALAAYLDTACWASGQDSEPPLYATQLTGDTISALASDWLDFRTSMAEHIEASGLPLEEIAQCFWLSRNRNGAGFIDHRGEPARAMLRHAHAYGEQELWRASDGRVFIA